MTHKQPCGSINKLSTGKYTGDIRAKEHISPADETPQVKQFKAFCNWILGEI
jgi:hypothetical protein